MSHAHFLLPACSSGAATAAVASAANPNKRKVEPYGRAYQATKHAAPKLSSAEEETAVASASNVLQLRDAKYDRYKKFDIELNDYYTLLGLEDKMFDSTKEEITEAYRTLCKVIHPDKALPEDRVKAEERYKALQVGWETLTDAARRRGYDSSLEFDDALPKEKEGSSEKTFFSVYGPVFDSNARFSVNRPVPKLGDINTSDDDVQEFYDFWNSFQSWREFPELNKNTLESASCREQKREYERENAKAQAGKKKEELARVRKLTDMAYKKDPRVQRMIAKRDEAKNAAKKKKEDEAREKEEAALRKAFEEEQRKERLKLQEAKDKEDKKNFKEVQKKTRAAFGKACKAAALDDEKTDILRASLELEQLQEIVAEFTKDPKSPLAIQMWNSYIERIQSEEAKRKAMSAEQLAADKAAQKKLEEDREAASAKPWTHDEEQILTKAVTKYPPGTLLRWETITDMVNSITSRSIKDVIRKAKMMESGDLGSQHVDDNAAYQLYLQKMGKAPAAAASSSSSSAPAASATFTVEEQALFEKALKAVNKDAKDRWTQIAAQVKTKTAEQCEARFNQIKEDIKKNKK